MPEEIICPLCEKGYMYTLMDLVIHMKNTHNMGLHEAHTAAKKHMDKAKLTKLQRKQQRNRRK